MPTNDVHIRFQGDHRATQDIYVHHNGRQSDIYVPVHQNGRQRVTEVLLLTYTMTDRHYNVCFLSIFSLDISILLCYIMNSIVLYNLS